MAELSFALAESPIEAAALREHLRADDCGAFACFEGWVRDHNGGRAVRGLEYTSYRALAETEGAAILREAGERFDIAAACCVHRVGELAIGDMAVWVGVGAAHRGPAFEACRWIIDEVKSRVPIWKNERYADGEGQWLHPQPPG